MVIMLKTAKQYKTFLLIILPLINLFPTNISPTNTFKIIPAEFIVAHFLTFLEILLKRVEKLKQLAKGIVSSIDNHFLL